MDIDERIKHLFHHSEGYVHYSPEAVKQLIKNVLDEVCRPATDKLSDSIQEHEVILVHNVKLRRKKLGL